MSNINITYGTPIKMVVTLTDLADRNGKTISDITDVVYMLKHNRSDDDSATVFNKSVKNGANVTLTATGFETNILAEDYGNSKTKIQAFKNYLVCIGIEFNDSGYYIEDYDPRFDRKLSVLPDKVRM